MLHRVQTPCCNNFFFSIKSKCGSDLAHTNDMAVPDFPARPILISCRQICTYQHSRLSRSEWNALRRRSRASWSSFRVALPRQCRTFVIFSIRVQRSSGWPQRRGHGPLYHPRFVLGGTLAKGLCSISFIQSNDTVLDFGSGVGQNIFDGSCVGKMFLLSIESPSLLLPSSSCSLSSDNNGTR